MLGRIIEALQTAGRPLCLADLSVSTGIEEPALEGMLETLVARRRLRTYVFEGDGCCSCPVKGGCFIMNDGVAVTYGLAPDANVAIRSTFALTTTSSRGI